MRELHGIPHQVGHHLANPPRVADEMARHVRRILQHQVELAILDLRRQHFVDFLDRQPQVEGQRFDLHPSRFDLGEVQNVVDDRHQGFSRLAHGLGVLPLFRSQVGIEQQARHPDHAIHRRADLVTHVGQKLALRLVGGFRRFLGFDRPEIDKTFHQDRPALPFDLRDRFQHGNLHAAGSQQDPLRLIDRFPQVGDGTSPDLGRANETVAQMAGES